MKKFVLMICLLLSIPIQLVSAKERASLSIFTKGDVTKNTTVKRAPMSLPIEVIFDETTRTIEVISEEEIEAEVYIKSEDGDILGYSSCLNTALIVPSDFIGILTISIECDEWTAVGEIEI